jgi:Holliday junction resolvase RusA-like endonuclease
MPSDLPVARVLPARRLPAATQRGHLTPAVRRHGRRRGFYPVRFQVQPVTITVPGKPFAWRRARSVGKIRFKDAGTVQTENAVQAIALQQLAAPLEGPLKISVHATFKIPASWSKAKAAAHMWRHHTQTPDLSNIIKFLEDALNRVAWVDDSQIAEYGRCSKLWADREQTVLIIERAGPQP